MFKVLNARKRRVISPAIVVASVAAHVLLLGGAVYAAAGDTGDTGPQEPKADTVVFSLAPEPPAVEPPAPTPSPPAPQQPAKPDAPAPVPGEVLQVPEVRVVPGIRPEVPGTVDV